MEPKKRNLVCFSLTNPGNCGPGFCNKMPIHLSLAFGTSKSLGWFSPKNTPPRQKTQHLPGEIRHQGGGNGPTTCHTEPFSNHQQSRTSPVPWWRDFSFFQRNPPVTDPPPRTSTRPDQAPESSNSLTESQLENGWGSSDSFPRDELVDENG